MSHSIEYKCISDSFRLLILVLPFISFNQLKQPSEYPQPRLLQLPCIHQFPPSFQEMRHQFLFIIVFRWIPMIRFDEAFHLIVSYQPSFVLGHNR